MSVPRTTRPTRGTAFSVTSIVLAAMLIVQACTNREVVGVVVSSVTVRPSNSSLVEGDSLAFAAEVEDDRGNALPDAAAVEWSVEPSGILAVDSTGMVRALQRGTATVRAMFKGVSGQASVTVIPAPNLAVSQSAVAFFGGAGGTPPAPRIVAVTNGGGGTLGGVGASVQYAPAQPTGWLTAALGGTTAPTGLTLTPTITGLAVGDYSATVTLTSPDDRDGPSVVTVTLSLTGMTVTQTGGTTSVAETGTTDTFTVRLESQPASSVTLTVTSGDTGEVTVAPASATFTPANWSTPQTVTVTGVDDLIADGAQITNVIVSVDDASSDDPFDALDDVVVAVTTTDNDVAGATVSAISGQTTEAGGQATFTVRLNTQPTANVTIGLSSSDATEGTVAPATLTFTTANWSTAQTATVTGVNDEIDDDNVVYTIVTAAATSTDAAFSGLDAADVTVTNVDDSDAAGFVVAPTSGLSTTETGGQTTFTMRLTSQPTANVTIGLSSSDLTEGGVVPASLTFTAANWSITQTVTITSQDDAVADGDVAYTIVTAPATSTDAKYSGLNPADVSVTNVDDETAGFTVTPASGPTTEPGGQATFTVVLNNAPSANVTIGLTSSDTSEGTISTGSLTFTVANWSTPQTVTVTGVNDDADDGDIVYAIVTAPATSADLGYNGVDMADVAVTNVDDETAGFAVTAASGPTTEAGGQATFTIRLTSQPTANVNVGLTSNDLTEGTAAPTSVTFTSANWNSTQTVTATGVNDALADGNIIYTIVTAAAASTDPSYAGLNPPDVSVTNVDDETAGITVSAASGPTTEAGGQATFNVVLNTQPTANVTVGLSSSDTSEGTIAVASVTFTSANWNTPQTVTVTGVNDDLDDGDIGYSIVTAAATSTDPNYTGLNPANVSITNVDDETAGFTISPPTGPTTEVGGQA
ncbi:MAG: Ig-like domain-containing protein, partial [Longimicrobiales bacterium]